MGEEPTKYDLLLCLLSDIEQVQYEYWDSDIGLRHKDQIKERAEESWILQDMYDFAHDSEYDLACDILGDYYNRVHQFYRESVSSEAKQIFVHAMNESSNMYEYLLMLKEEMGE